MQRLFADDSPWASMAVSTAMPAIREICLAKPQSSIFTRFLCPPDPCSLRGQWATFYAACPALTRLDPRLFDIVPELAGIAGHAPVISRFVFSAFHGNDLEWLLHGRSTDTLVFTGVETDICVLATILQAIDRGYRVIVVEEGVASSNPAGHAGAMNGVLPRFDQQVEIVGVSDLLTRWR